MICYSAYFHVYHVARSYMWSLYHVYVCGCGCVFVVVSIYIYIRGCMYVYMHVYVCLWMCDALSVYTWVYLFACIYAYIYIYAWYQLGVHARDTAGMRRCVRVREVVVRMCVCVYRIL